MPIPTTLKQAGLKRAGLFALVSLALAIVLSASPVAAQVIDADDRPADDQITRLYQAVFDRDADAEGFEFWTSQYRDTGSLHAIAAQFAASDEFIDRYGSNPSNEALVEAMYENVLGREGDADGVRFWLDQLDSGAMTQVGVLVAFTDSTENIDRTGTSQPLLAEDAQILRLYRSAFGRFPDAGGFEFWKAQYTSATPLRDIALRFSQSPEFTDIYGASPRPDQLVSRLYMNVLGREGETAGVAFWEGEYIAGRSIPELLVAFADSGENLQKTGTAANPSQAAAVPASLLPTPVLKMTLPSGTCGLTEFTGTQLTNGASTLGSFGEEIAIVEGGVGLTDLNNDGATDAVIQLSCYGGGNAVWSDVVVWIAGQTPAPLDIDLHEVISVRAITSVATAITSPTVAPGVVQIEWAGASGADASCCPSTTVTTEVSFSAGTIVVTDTQLNGPELNAISIVTAAQAGGPLPAGLPVTAFIWGELTTWLGGSAATIDSSPCFRDADPSGFTCLFATPGAPVGIATFLYMTQEGPADIWSATNWEGVIHAT